MRDVREVLQAQHVPEGTLPPAFRGKALQVRGESFPFTSFFPPNSSSSGRVSSNLYSLSARRVQWTNRASRLGHNDSIAEVTLKERHEYVNALVGRERHGAPGRCRFAGHSSPLCGHRPGRSSGMARTHSSG